jgi:hypothetical protein
MRSESVAKQILLQVAVRDIGQLTDFEPWLTSPGLGGILLGLAE